MAKNDLARVLPGHLLVGTMDEKDPEPKSTTARAGQAEPAQCGALAGREASV